MKRLLSNVVCIRHRLLPIFLVVGTLALAEGDHEATESNGSETQERRRQAAPERVNAADLETSVAKLTDLISDSFLIRKSRAKTHAEFLLGAIQGEEDREVAKDVVSLVTSLTPEQKEDALKRVREEIADESTDEKTKEAARRIAWILEEVSGSERGNSSLENGLKDEVGQVKEEAQATADKFQENLDKAANGDEAARRAILERYKPEQLMDYLSQHQGDATGAKLARVLGWQDKNGTTYLDVDMPSDNGGTEAQTWTLGNTDEEIQNALKAFDTQSVNAPASTSKQLQQANLHRDPSNPEQRKFIQPTKDGLQTHDPKILSPEESKAICRAGDPPILAEQTAKHRPYYFFRPFPLSNQVSYASKVDGKENRNFIKDMETGKERGIPGPYDPVPTPDELYMTIPEGGIKIFDMKDLSGAQEKPTPIYDEEKLPQGQRLRGVYQSTGILKKDVISTTYRIITDMDGLSFRDYRIYTLNGRDTRVEPLRDRPSRLCGNLGTNISLPMLSKDGRFISLLDTKENVTKIYEIAENGQKCDLVGNLGFATGKVDFGFDNDEPVVAFHKMINQDEDEGSYPTVPSDKLSSDVYLYHLKTRRIQKLTHNTDEHSIYPAFRKDGTITYLQHPKNATGDNSNPPSRFITINPKDIPEISTDFLQDPNKRELVTAAGSLWNELCSSKSQSFTGEAAALTATGIPTDICKRMVETYWDDFEGEVRKNKRLTLATGLTKEQIAAACLEPERGGWQGNGSGDGSGVTAGEVAPIVEQLCVRCHISDNKIPWTDKEALNAPGASRRGKSFLDDMTDRIEAPLRDADGNYNMLHMPRGVDLTEAQMEEIKRWIQSMRTGS